MARTYKRDANGRFAGGGGSGRVTGGSLKARSSARRSRAKLAGKAQGDKSLSGSMSRRAQRAAVTRTGKAAAAAKAANRTKLAGGRRAGTVGKVRGVQQKRQAKPAVKRQQQPLTPSQLRGQRRRASERPEVRLERAQARANRRLQELQATKSSLETALRRRRGKLDEASKKATAQNLSKTNRRIERLKDANALYRQDIGTASARRGAMMDYRTGKKVPETDATRRNRLSVLRRRVSYLRKNEVKPTDVWGGEYDGPQLSAARKALTAQATTGMQGMRVTLRSKKQAATAQRSRSNALIEKANATKYGLPGRGSGGKFGLGTKTVKLAIVQQGNMLTGKTDRVRGRRFMPAKPRRRS